MCQGTPKLSQQSTLTVVFCITNLLMDVLQQPLKGK
jgi:hypothetical protein